MQAGILFHYLTDAENNCYFEQLLLDIHGKVDRQVFERAWSHVVDGNEMLRTFFRWEEIENPVQIVLKKHLPEIRYYDLSGVEPGKNHDPAGEIAAKDKKEKFDIRSVPFRLTLCKTIDAYRLIISYHHIILDGWSMGIILREFFSAYEHLTRGEEPVPHRKTRFKEFIRVLKNRDDENREAFWAGYLHDVENHTPLSIQTAARAEALEFDVYTHCAGQPLTSRLNQFARDLKITLSSLLYSGWGLLLQRYGNSGDVCFGTTLSGRNVPLTGIEQMAGLFINTIPLRAQTRPGQDTPGYLHAMQDQIEAREPHSLTPLVDIKKYCGLDNEKELFDSLVVIENYPLSGRTVNVAGQLDVSFRSMEENSNYDLTLAITIQEDIHISFHYNRALLSIARVRAMAGHFQNILENMITSPDEPASALDILKAHEKEFLVTEVNRTRAGYPLDKPIHYLIEQQAQNKPDAVAMAEPVHQFPAGANHLTYRQLELRAERLARILRDAGTQSGNIAAVVLPNGPDMMIAFLAALKAGAAFLPIDPGLPAQRISFMLKDSMAASVVCRRGLKDRLPGSVQAIFIDDLLFENAGEQGQARDRSVQPGDHAYITHDYAYIIYTSGSTGIPKGVVIRHDSLLNLCFWHNDHYHIIPSDRASKFASPSFDATIWETFPYFLAGASLFFIPPDVKFDIQALNRFFETYCITAAFLPTRLCEQFSLLANRSLRLLLTGGEKLNRFSPQNYLLVNNYGPTENTVVTTCFPLDRQFGEIPIGTPIANTRLYILDKYLRLQPFDVPGQLYISGIGLADGYLNRPRLTADAFIPNPFEPGQIMYRTGDLVKRTRDRNIHFLGRVDQQVNIRGFRVELGEIENWLRQFPGSRDALAVVRDIPGNPGLICAYIVTNGEELNPGDIREFLGKHLPGYMIPAYFIPVETIPVTASGKVNHRLLPAPVPREDCRYVQPSGPVEERLAEIWGNILGLDKTVISADSDFFQLGGHSLNATILLAKLQKTFRIDIKISHLFQYKTLSGMSGFIKTLKENRGILIEPTEKRDYYPVSPMQKHFYFQQQMAQASRAFNISHYILLDEKEDQIDIDRLTAALKMLTRRHESLRTSFHMIDDDPVQRVHADVPVTVKYFEIRRQDIPRFVQEFLLAFDLAVPPLFRAALVRYESTRYLLVIDMNHLISDGFSTEILENDFRAILAGNPLPPLPVQYRDFLFWRRSPGQQRVLKRQMEFWLNEFSGHIPELNLPVDYPRRFVGNFEGKTVRDEIDAPAADQMRAVAAGQGSTLFILLLSAYYVLLAKLSSQEDIIVGTALSGRQHADLTSIVGLFFNTLALRRFPAHDKTFKQFFKEVETHTLECFENQDYGFGSLVEELVTRGHLTRSPERNPLFDAMIALQNYIKPAFKNNSPAAGDNFRPENDFEGATSKFDLLLNINEQKDKITLSLDYSTALFKPSTAERILFYYRSILEQVTGNVDIILGDISLPSDSVEITCGFEHSDFDNFEF